MQAMLKNIEGTGGATAHNLTFTVHSITNMVDRFSGEDCHPAS